MSAVAREAAIVAAIVVLAGCSTMMASSPMRCSAGEAPGIHDQLYFGTTRRNGAITPEEWASFLAQTVTRKLPGGFTVWDATGQWRDGEGRIVKEATHVLSVAHPDDAPSEQVVLDIAAAYRARFDQHGVYRIRTAVCSSDLRGNP